MYSPWPSDSPFKHFDNLAADRETALCLCVFALLCCCILMCVYGLAVAFNEVCAEQQLLLAQYTPAEAQKASWLGGWLHQPSLHHAAPEMMSRGPSTFTMKPLGVKVLFVLCFQDFWSFDYRLTFIKPLKNCVSCSFLLCAHLSA